VGSCQVKRRKYLTSVTWKDLERLPTYISEGYWTQ